MSLNELGIHTLINFKGNLKIFNMYFGFLIQKLNPIEIVKI